MFFMFENSGLLSFVCIAFYPLGFRLNEVLPFDKSLEIKHAGPKKPIRIRCTRNVYNIYIGEIDQFEENMYEIR